MKTSTFILLPLISIVFCISNLHAGVEYKSFKQKVVVEEEYCNFRDMEFQIDGFGAFVAGPCFETHGHTLNTGVGGGTGINFFFARYFGLGGEAFWYGNGGTAEHMFIGNAFLRYPICAWNLAPYLMVGGGFALDHVPIGFGHVGGGIEWRIHRNIGLFIDSRFLYGAPNLAGVTRTGFRIAF